MSGGATYGTASQRTAVRLWHASPPRPRATVQPPAGRVPPRIPPSGQGVPQNRLTSPAGAREGQGVRTTSSRPEPRRSGARPRSPTPRVTTHYPSHMRDSRGRDLRRRHLVGARLANADFAGATLADADLWGVDLTGADRAVATFALADRRDAVTS